MERRLLWAVVILLAMQFVVQVVPGPFRHCTSEPTGETLFGVREVNVTCEHSWWP